MGETDLISRQAAIGCMMRLQREDEEAYGASIPEGFDGDRAAEALMQLPSVQPERKTSEWLHEYLQTAVDFGIITETQASRLMDMIDDSEDNT